MKDMAWTVIIKNQNNRVYSRSGYSSPDYLAAYIDFQKLAESDETIVAIVKGSHEVYSYTNYLEENPLS